MEAAAEGHVAEEAEEDIAGELVGPVESGADEPGGCLGWRGVSGIVHGVACVV